MQEGCAPLPLRTKKVRLSQFWEQKDAHAQNGKDLSPPSTMLKLRLCQGACLPKFTTHSASEIARTAGFQSPFHFSWQFKA